MLPNNRITGFLTEHHVLTMSTCVDSKSWCSNCFYVYLEDEATFLFTSDIDTKHIRMAIENPVVSGSVVLETTMVGKIRGIQFTGSLKKVSKENHSKYNKKYLLKYPFAVLSSTELWLLKLDTIKMTDNRLGFGKKLHWNREEK